MMILLLLLGLLVCLFPATAHAYIGPGAGFTFLSSLVLLFGSFVLALFSLLTWPVRALIRAFKGHRALSRARVKRVVVLGLDGLDAGLMKDFMDRGLLPNFRKLRTEGTFSPLKSTTPSMSPVAWSSFITGVEPSKHNIFDFLDRDLRTYLPNLSSTRIVDASRYVSLGRYRIPLGRPRVRSLRKSKSFWKILGEHGIFSTILRVPMTFPPEKFHGAMLSAMCVPDLRGTQGTFTYYTSDPQDDRVETGGVRIHVRVEGDRVRSHVPGPENSMTREREELRVPFEAEIDRVNDTVLFDVDGEKFRLPLRTYSEWVRLRFKPGLGIKVQGICRFYVLETEPHFRLYVSPVNIDPEKPATPIGHPLYYPVYLSKLLGSYATLGLAEDTWAVNEGVLDEEAFLDQTWKNHREREEQFFNALKKTRRGLMAVVFDASDRVQHMFWRFTVNGHPAAKGRDVERYRKTIEDMYRRMDDLVGRTLEAIGGGGGKKDEGTVLLVISDHGFTNFQRGVNLNAWLRREGYLHLVEGGNPDAKWFQGIDWSRTRAYVFGLTGLYINVKGREARGTVSRGDEYEAVKKEIKTGLEKLVDPATGRPVFRTVYDRADIYHGPYADNGPDLILGYNTGYRNSWDAATGVVGSEVVEDNVKGWSGDHCVDPEIVYGILFSDRKLEVAAPALMDIGPTVLDWFGVEVPRFMDGKAIRLAGGNGARPRAPVEEPEVREAVGSSS
jgi:predicted AlkP superfamily phosphohydrolase/phosphomutase